MWRKLRITAALAFFSALTFLFVDVSGIVATDLDFLAEIQLMPAILSGSVFIVAALLLLTLLLGRIYCSVLCPLGVLQDILAKAGSKVRGPKGYRYRPSRPFWR